MYNNCLTCMQEKVKKLLTTLLASTPEQREVLFQRIGIVSPEVRQQWLLKAKNFQQQQRLQQSRMQMMGGMALMLSFVD